MNERDRIVSLLNGAADADWRVQDRIGGEYKPFQAVEPEHLSDALPSEIRDQIGAWVYAVTLDTGVLYDRLPAGATQYILTGAVNDVIGLVRHVDAYDGRSAAHSARALFEHLVNLHDVLDSSKNTSDRYLDHKFVTANQVAGRRWYLDFLDKSSAKRERNRLDGLANRTRKPLADAIAKYGSSFKRSWADQSLRDRAAAHNLSDGYEGYRILSSVVHASSGAMAGIVKPIDGHPVHRIGYDMDLAGTAYAEGLMSFYRFADRLKEEVDGPEVDEILGRTGNLLFHLQKVRETLRRIDARTWPTAALGPPTITVAAVWPNGTVRWYLHDRRDDSIVRAVLLDPPPDLSEIKKLAAEYDPENFGGRPMSVALSEARAMPEPGARRAPATSIIVPPNHPAHPAAATHGPRSAQVPR